jgi:hypothetical protein
MGNLPSSESKLSSNQDKDFKNMYNLIDYIATYYILTSNFNDLKRLTEKEYCDKLLILTSDVIQQKLNNVEITYLAQRLERGEEVNLMTNENVTFIGKEELNNLAVKDGTTKKQRMCIGIAKFYIKIAHVFASIVTTINPIYVYKDETGNTVKRGLLTKDKIPKNTKRTLYKLNICDNRIRALKNGEVYNEQTGNVTLQPKLCDINLNSDGEVKNLEDEPGILELKQLYFDDKYDYSNGTFHDMSPEMRKQYENDVATFYREFSGDTTGEPPKDFDKIKLRDYSKTKACSKLSKPITISKKDALFTKYAQHVQSMIQRAATKQSELLEVINELFTYSIDPKTGTRRIRVNPKLTEASLNTITSKTRKIIVGLYVGCEIDYIEGAKLLEAMTETVMLQTTEQQIKNLQNEAKRINEELMKPPKDDFIEKPSYEQDTKFGKSGENEYTKFGKSGENDDLGVPGEFTKEPLNTDDVLYRPTGFADRPENFPRV